jgi:hypothetical protein
MALRVSQSTLLPLTLLLIWLPLLTAAYHPGRLENNWCPADPEQLVYSPFKAYFFWYPGNVQNCWAISDCLFETAGESRKQQFAATALIMGLIPLTLKDIAWPERRTVYVTKPLNPFLEVLVLALGLVPEEPQEKDLSSEMGKAVHDWDETRRKNMAINALAKVAWRWSRVRILVVIGITAVALVACYAGLVVMEVYSKRSALGCPFPAFVATWYILALVPAAIHALFASFRRRPINKSRSLLRHDEWEQPAQVTSAVPGVYQQWPVQLAWAIYFIAGTLVHTSIMAVLVLELVVWVALGIAMTVCSKLSAFFLCLAFEKTGQEAEKAEDGASAKMLQ